MSNETRADQFVLVDEEGSVRDLAPDERAYINTDFLPFDGGRPYIKRTYEERNGWGNLRGFIRRDLVPPHLPIAPAPSRGAAPLDIETMRKIVNEKRSHKRS